MKRIAFVVALAASVAVGAVSNDEKKDKAFVQEVAMANMAEVELGEVALEFGAAAAVKDFGRMMIDHHSDAGNKLAEVARQHDIATSSALAGPQQELRDKLSRLRGSAFDREYMEKMIEGHERLLDRLESRVDDSSRAGWKIRMSINQWAAALYPVVWRHHRSAKALYNVYSSMEGLRF